MTLDKRCANLRCPASRPITTTASADACRPSRGTRSAEPSQCAAHSTQGPSMAQACASATSVQSPSSSATSRPLAPKASHATRSTSSTRFRTPVHAQRAGQASPKPARACFFKVSERLSTRRGRDRGRRISAADNTSRARSGPSRSNSRWKAEGRAWTISSSSSLSEPTYRRKVRVSSSACNQRRCFRLPWRPSWERLRSESRSCLGRSPLRCRSRACHKRGA
mmetsp:Transcript_12818/g.36914  ORF Transcript_12818/g.36914 Transcript_12818/m.36914 type:complete len:223 (-) Transcript_12818:2-670(-)